jgi:hypothetical protein
MGPFGEEELEIGLNWNILGRGEDGGHLARRRIHPSIPFIIVVLALLLVGIGTIDFYYGIEGYLF